MRDKSQLDFLISNIRKFLKTSEWLTPVNFAEEKNKFFGSKSYNPKFKYPKIPINELQTFLKKLNSFKIEDIVSIENIITKKRVKETTLKLKLILSRGKPNFSKLSAKLYQLNFDKETLKFAQKDAVIKGKFEPQEDLSAKQAAAEIRKYLINTYNIKDWKVQISCKKHFYFRVESQRKKILVSKEVNWDFCDLDNTFAHEIDGHVIRAVNAANQKNPLFHKPLPFYIKTEEGLACLLADYFSTTANLSRKHHALKYLAGYLALKRSFRKVYDFLIENGVTKSLAFRRTFKLKKGFEDTSLPGCFAKEAMYYEGMMEVKKFLDNGGNIKKLYAGKVGLEDLKYTPIPEKIIIPPRIRGYLK